jgi:hypothetical protein
VKQAANIFGPFSSSPTNMAQQLYESFFSLSLCLPLATSSIRHGDSTQAPIKCTSTHKQAKWNAISLFSHSPRSKHEVIVPSD